MIFSHLQLIDINEPWEFEYWSGRFGVTRLQLAEAIEAVGSRAIDVQQYLCVSNAKMRVLTRSR